MVLMGSPMNIEIEWQNDLYIIRCKGRFIAGPEVEYMHAKMDEIQRLNSARLLVDFREVPAIGSMGVTFIVGLYTSVVSRSGRLVLVGAAPLVRQALDLTRLSTVISLAPDIESGLAALREQNSSSSVHANAGAG